MTSGVPHESVLRPLPFLFYINDLPQNIHAQVRLFPDNTAVYLTDPQIIETPYKQPLIPYRNGSWRGTWSLTKQMPGTPHHEVKTPIEHQVLPSWSGTRGNRHIKNLGVSIFRAISLNDHIHSKTEKANGIYCSVFFALFFPFVPFLH